MILNLNLVSRFVSDNNVVGDPLWVETLRHPEKKNIHPDQEKSIDFVQGIDFEGRGVTDIG